MHLGSIVSSPDQNIVVYLLVLSRQRYWARSYFGYPPVRDALPNPTHYAIAALQYASLVTHLITQNVDGLHRKAISGVPGWDEKRMDARILELHGTLRVSLPTLLLFNCQKLDLCTFGTAVYPLQEWPYHPARAIPKHLVSTQSQLFDAGRTLRTIGHEAAHESRW